MKSIVKMHRYFYTFMHVGCETYRWTGWTTENWNIAKIGIKGGYPKLIKTETDIEEIESEKKTHNN